MIDRLRVLAMLVVRATLTRYLLASICALASDMALFLALDQLGAPPLLAAFGGYGGGLLVHWVISIRFVFDTGTGPTHVQRAGFVASALLGMGLTLLLVGGLSALGLAPALAKLVSIPVSFFTVYAIRTYAVFVRA